jgi:hypothetical protein
MINNHQSILAYQENNGNDNENITINENEKKILVNLYNDTQIKQSRKIGQTETFIIENIFHNKTQIAKKAIISLVQKQLIKCSYKHYYYINSTYLNKIEQIHTLNQKYLIKEKVLEKSINY